MSTPASNQVSPISNSSLSSHGETNGHPSNCTPDETSESGEINGSNKRKPRIAVIGAGMAGLRAAQALLEESDGRYNVTVLEARDRIGGRICTSTSLGKPVDLGPNWVHGTYDNPIIPLAESVKAKFHDFYNNRIVYEVDGKVLDNRKSDALWNELWNVIERAFRYSKRYKDVIDDRWSLWDYCATIADFRWNGDKVAKDGDETWEAERRRILTEELVFDIQDAADKASGMAVRGTLYGGEGVKERKNGHANRRAGSPNEENGINGNETTAANEVIPISERDEALTAKQVNGRSFPNGKVEAKVDMIREKELFMLLVEMWGTFVGDGVKKQSLRCFFLEEPMEGDNVFVASTYQPIVNKLAEPILSSNCIQFNSPVTRITSLAPDLLNSKSEVIVTIRHDKELAFDAVICTIPLGCLKQNSVQFWPPLPRRILESIDSLGYGNLEKVYIEFPSPAFWMLESSNETRPPDSMTFLHQPLSIEPEMTTNERKWHLAAFSLAHLEEPYSQPVLLFYSYGGVSKFLTSSDFAAHFVPSSGAEEDDERMWRQQETFLKQIFEPYFSKLPNYDRQNPLCRPKNVVRTSWTTDPYAGYGSYTNFQVGLRHGDEDVLALRGELEEGPDGYEGCGKVMENRRVWFAGEHTAPVVGLGTVAGAYWSGEQAVERMRRALERGR